MDEFRKIKKKKSKSRDGRLKIENVEELTKERDDSWKGLLDSIKAEYDCNSYDPNGQEKLIGIPQLSNNESNLNILGYNQVYCDDKGDKNDMPEHGEKKKRLTEIHDTESDHLDIRKRKRLEKKKMRSKMWEVDNEASKTRKNDPPFDNETKEDGVHSKELGDISTKKRRENVHFLSLGTDDVTYKKGKKMKHTLGSETITNSSEMFDDYQTTKINEKGERHRSLSEVNNDNHNRDGMESDVNEDMLRINSYESDQYDNNSLSSMYESHCQIPKSEGVQSVDDIDYDDEHYKVPFRVRKPRSQKKSKSEPVNHGLTTSDEGVSETPNRRNIGLAAVSSYSTPMYSLNKETEYSDEENAILPSKHGKPQKNYEELLYSFPIGEGIPPEEIEEIPEKFCHWKKIHDQLEDNEFTVEEIKEEIDNKINYLYGYFRRLEENNLTEEELEEIRPRDFRQPYLPTYKHLEFFDTLDIKITWALNPLHQSALRRKSKHKENIEDNSECDYATEEESGFNRDKSRFKPRENEIIMRNWIRFQEEYGFYDLRPMVSIRTTRISKDGGITTFQPYRYIDPQNEKQFAVYLSQGLPERLPTSVLGRMRLLTSQMVDNTVKRTYNKISGRYLGKMVLMLKMFGKCFPGIELIVGHYTAREFYTFFQTHIWMQNIELRRGVWTEAERERLKKGIFDVLKVKSLEEAAKDRIKWVKIMPYIRTRNYRNIRVRMLYEIGKVKKTKKKQNRKDKAKVIELLYKCDVESMDAIDWQTLAQHFPDKNPYRLLNLFRKIYYNKVPHKHRSSFEDGIKYLYEKVLPHLQENLAEAEVEMPDHTAVVSGVDVSSEFADGNVNDFEFEAVSGTSETCSIPRDVNGTDLIDNTGAEPERDSNYVDENRKSYHQIQCSQAHSMSESESE